MAKSSKSTVRRPAASPRSSWPSWCDVPIDALGYTLVDPVQAWHDRLQGATTTDPGDSTDCAGPDVPCERCRRWLSEQHADYDAAWSPVSTEAMTLSATEYHEGVEEGWLPTEEAE